jgi:hypothetical protein
MRLIFATFTVLFVGMMVSPSLVLGQPSSPSMRGGESFGSGGSSMFGGGGSGGGLGGGSGGGLGSPLTGQGGITQNFMKPSNTSNLLQTPFVGANLQSGSAGYVGAGAAQLFGTSGTGGGMNSGMQGLGSTGMQRYGGGGTSSSQYGGYRAGQFGGMSGGAYGGMQRGGAQGGNANTTSIRTQLTASFESRPSDAEKFSTSLPQRLTRLPGLHWSSPGQIEIQGRTVILRGSVATEHDRDLAERVARLEAGVEQVQNQLVVAPSSAKPAK